MMKTIIVLFTCHLLVAIAVATIEIPVECKFGSPEYNDALCNETCTKEAHISQPYCFNFTQPATPKLSAPSTASPLSTKPQEDKVTKEVTKLLEHPVIEDIDPKSDAPSLRSSLFFCASYLLLSLM